MGPEALKKKIDDESEGFKKLSKDMNQADKRISQLDGQLTENNMVKNEMDLLSSSDVVYKLIGPALIKQDTDEAKASVNKRIEYITGEIKRNNTMREKIKSDMDAK